MTPFPVSATHATNAAYSTSVPYHNQRVRPSVRCDVKPRPDGAVYADGGVFAGIAHTSPNVFRAAGNRDGVARAARRTRPMSKP